MKLEKGLIILTLLVNSFFASAQASSDSVNFDTYVSATDNDLTNRFTDITALVQSPTHGITGGAVQTTLQAYMGSATYNKLYAIASTTTAMSLCFKYDASLYDNSRVDEAAQISYTPTSGLGYLNLGASGDKLFMQSVTQWTVINVPSGGTLTDGHWYKMQGDFTLNPVNDSFFYANMYLYDIGTSGMSTPALVLSKTNFVMPNDFVYYPGGLAEVKISGGQDGGGAYLDNFNITGDVALGVIDVPKSLGLSMPGIVSSNLPVSIDNQQRCMFNIYNINGSLIKQGSFNRNTNIDVTDLAPALYIVQFNENGNTASRKFIKQ